MADLRLLYITPYPPEPSGIADYAHGFAGAIGSDCAVEIMSAGRGERFSHSFHAVREGISLIKGKLRAKRFNLIHIEMGRSLLVGFYAGLFCTFRYPRVPLVLTLHDPPGLVWHPLMFAGLKNLSLCNVVWALFSAPAEWLLERLLYRRARMVLVFSERARELLRSQKGAQRIAVIPMGVQSYPARTRGDRIQIGYYGYLYREKGVEVLITAIAELTRTQPQLLSTTSFTICGTVSKMSNINAARHYQQSLNALIDREGLRSIIAIKSDISAADEERFFVTTDILVLPYLRSDTLATSSVLIKGLAAGCAVIASDVKTFSEVIEHGHNGLLVPPRDPAALARAMRSLIGDRLEAERLGDEARRRSAAANHWPVVARRVREIYEEVTHEAMAP